MKRKLTRKEARDWDDKLFMEHLANNSFNPKKPWYKRWWNWSLIKLGIKEKPRSCISFDTNQKGVSIDDDGKISIKLRKEPD